MDMDRANRIRVVCIMIELLTNLFLLYIGVIVFVCVTMYVIPAIFMTMFSKPPEVNKDGYEVNYTDD